MGERETERNRERQHRTFVPPFTFFHPLLHKNVCQTTEDGSSGSPYLRVTVRAAEIRQEQLLTIDYDAMEIEMSSPFDCRCGADNCRGRVSGFANMAPAAQREYAGGGTAAAAATRRVVGGGRPTGPLPLTGAVKAWAKQNNLPRTR